MKKILSIIIMVGTMAGVLSYQAFSAGPQFSDGFAPLRGKVALDRVNNAPAPKVALTDKAQLARSFAQQPPLIPHPIDGFQLDLKNNQCLGCHSVENYKTYGATRISQTHFVDRSGKTLDQVSSRRYFCNQCHVVQTSATPLVQNTFRTLGK